MYNNIGEKIKNLAKIICWIGIIFSVLTGIVIMVSNIFLIIIGIFYAIAGSILSWILSFTLYGYGEIIVQLTTLTSHTVKSEFGNNSNTKIQNT